MKLITLFSLSFCVFSQAAFSAPAQRNSDYVAKINNKMISKEYFEKRYLENAKFFQLKPPTRESVLDDIIKRELGIQAALKLGLEKDPEIQDRMNTVLYHAYLEKKLAKQFEGIHIEDAEARAFYEKSPEIRTSHIFVSVPPGTTKEEEKKSYEKIKNILDRYVKPGKMSFSEVAQRFSEGTVAAMGGDLDYQTSDKLDPNFYRAAIGLKKPGTVSGIVRSGFGFHIIRLTAIRSWAEVDRAKIKRLIIEEHKQKIFEAHMADLRKRAQVSVNLK